MSRLRGDASLPRRGTGRRVFAALGLGALAGCLSVGPSIQPGAFPEVPAPRVGAVSAATDSATVADRPAVVPSGDDIAGGESSGVKKPGGWSRLWEPFQRAKPIPLPLTHDTTGEPAAAPLNDGF